MKQRIEQRLAELHLTPRGASLRVSRNADLIRGVLRADDPNPTRETIDKIAGVLQVTPEWLLGNDPNAPLPLPAAPEFIAAEGVTPVAGQSMPKDVPVWGGAMGSLIDTNFEGFHLFTGQPVDYVRRPPALAGVRDAYSIYVNGDSMDPMHPHGALRFIHPHRPPQPGDTVVVMTKHWDSDPGQGYIKILRRRQGDKLVLEQLNPQARIEIPLQYVVSVHKVLDMNDLFGV